MDGYIIGGVPMSKTSASSSNIDADGDTDDAVRLFKQKIKRLEKAAQAGQLDVSEKKDDGGVWLNNLDSFNVGKESPPVDDEKSKSNFPGLSISPPKIVIPPPLEGYEERINDLLRKEQKIQAEMLQLSNEDNVLKQITSVVDLSKPVEPGSGSQSNSGIKLVQSSARDSASDNGANKSVAVNVPRDMLLSKRGYQVKKLENSKAGYTKKVSHRNVLKCTVLYYTVLKTELEYCSFGANFRTT